MTNSLLELTSFSMRTKKPETGKDWFEIRAAKKGSDITKVYIYDEIGFWGTTAKDFAAALDEIETKEIHLHVNSPGGSVFDGIAIYNALRTHDAKVTAIVDGMAASAASFIIQAADERQMSRNAQLMIHDAKAFAGGNAAQMRQAATLLDRISDEIADIYAVNSDGAEGHKAKDFRDVMKAGDQWYNGNEAVSMGLMDEVTDNPDDDEPEDAAKNTWKAADVEAFLQTSQDRLAAAGHITTTNRVEEAPSTMDPVNTPPAAPQPPAQPAAQATPPVPAPPVQQPAPATAAVSTLMVNKAPVADMAAVQAHIDGLETFKTEAIENGRKTFVDKLASDGKILASQIKDTAAFALTLDSDQFDKWKAVQEAAPTSSLFETHGADGGLTQQTPANQVAKAKAARIVTLREIVQGHKDSGTPTDQIENMESYKELQKLEAESTSTPAS